MWTAGEIIRCSKVVVFVVLSLVINACGDPIEKSNNVAPNGTTNIGAGPVTLVLSNTTDQPIYVDGNCEQYWYGIRDSGGQSVRVNKSCGLCECGVESCAVCGACPAMEPVVLAPGDRLEFEWAGVHWASSSDQFRDSCVERRTHAAGTFTAEFCYGFTAGEFDVTDLECRSETFQLGAGGDVVHEPEATAMIDPVCEAADSNGFFSSCDPCGDDCDSIDAPNASGFACGCSGGCPCGFSCGSYEIAPNVVVGNICVR